MYAFELIRPKTVDEAVAALAEDGAQALGGGHTLIPTLKARLASPDKLVALSGIASMKKIDTAKAGVIGIGGGVTHAAVARELAASFPGLARLASMIGDPAVRNRGTIGGSLSNNDPAACYPAAALGSGATIVTNSRSIAADDYFQGLFTTALEPGEIITGVRFPVPEKSAYQKFAQPASRFALVGVFVTRAKDGKVRVAVTGASEDGVFRWTEAEEALTANFSKAALSGLTISAEGLIGDIHGTPAYRAHLIRVLTGRAVEAAT